MFEELASAQGRAVQLLSKGLDIRYGCRVSQVQYGKKGVKVVTQEGEESSQHISLPVGSPWCLLPSLSDRGELISGPQATAWGLKPSPCPLSFLHPLIR